MHFNRDTTKLRRTITGHSDTHFVFALQLLMECVICTTTTLTRKPSQWQNCAKNCLEKSSTSFLMNLLQTSRCTNKKLRIQTTSKKRFFSEPQIFFKKNLILLLIFKKMQKKTKLKLLSRMHVLKVK